MILSSSSLDDVIVKLLFPYTAYKLMREFSDLRKRYWGSHLWGSGYFCSTVGAVTGETVKRYIENQADEPDSFKVWDEGKDSSSVSASLDF
jgi:putative transposase